MTHKQFGGTLASQMRALRYNVKPPIDPDDCAAWEVHCPDGVTVLLAKDATEGWEKADKHWREQNLSEMVVRRTPMSEVLKPCPHCGGAAALQVSLDGDVEWVRCIDCCTEGTAQYSTDAAIAAWNHRVADHPVTSNPVADSEVGVGDRQAVQVTQAARDAADQFLSEWRRSLSYATFIPKALAEAFARFEQDIIARRRRRTASAPVATEAMKSALDQAHKAMAEYYRYWTGGEMRGSYDGRPERDVRHPRSPRRNGEG